MAHRVRLLLLATAATLLALPGRAAADPGDEETPHPGLVTALASCEHGSASITVWLEDEDTPAVRLDRVSPDTATLAKDPVVDPETDGMRMAVFEPVPAGEYTARIERGGDVPPDVVPVVVRPCTDTRPTDEPLRVEVDCQAGWGLVTYVVTNPSSKQVTRYFLTSGTVLALDKIHLPEGSFLEVTENGVEDRTYSVSLTDERDHKKIIAKKEFTVSCAEGNPPRLAVDAACSGTTGTVTVGVLNQNRSAVEYAVSIKDTVQKLTVKSGEKGTVSFPGIATGEHEVLVKSLEEKPAQAGATAKLDCGTTTTTTTTTTTPVPQGRSDSGLANTGASVGGLLGLGALALGLGGALLMIARRRARGNA